MVETVTRFQIDCEYCGHSELVEDLPQFNCDYYGWHKAEDRTYCDNKCFTRGEALHNK